MKRTNKKGFTIVELVIVIAVIAILAAVLIPTFTNLIKKAQTSKDTQLVRNLNTALVVDKASGNTHNTMTDALEAAKEAGYDVSKINASNTDNEILWDSANDVFCYYVKEESSVKYIPETTLEKEASDVDYWKISGDDEDLLGKYSVYYTGESTQIKTTVGFDAGETSGITSLTYDRSTATEGQKAVIRTNSQFTQLIINGPKDDVKHYGVVGVINIIAVKFGTYQEYGCVSELNLKAGKVEINNGSIVGKVRVDSSSTAENAAITNNGLVYGKETIEFNSENFEHTESSTDSDIITGISIKDATDKISISNAEQLINLAYAQSTGIMGNNPLNIEITADIDLTGKTWVPFGASDYFFEGMIDGKGHTIKGIKNDGYKREGTEIKSSTGTVQDPFGLISCAVGTVKISNLTVEVDIQDGGESVGGFIGTYQKKTYQDTLEFNSCTVKGTIKASKKVGGFVGTTYFATKVDNNNNEVQYDVDSYSPSNKTSFVNCHSNVEIVAGTRAGGFIGANNSYLTIFEGCSFENSVTVTSTATGKTNNWAVGGYIGYETSDPQKYNPNGETLNNNYAPSIVISSENKTSVKVVFNNCTSTGTISGNADTEYSKNYIGVEDKWAIIEGITGYNETSGHTKVELN